MFCGVVKAEAHSWVNNINGSNRVGEKSKAESVGKKVAMLRSKSCCLVCVVLPPSFSAAFGAVVVALFPSRLRRGGGRIRSVAERHEGGKKKDEKLAMAEAA